MAKQIIHVTLRRTESVIETDGMELSADGVGVALRPAVISSASPPSS